MIAASSVAAVRPTVPARIRRVLLVDDDPVQLKLSRLRLEDAGFAVDSASGAEEALQKARRGRPDVIVSDVLMDDVDGFGLCRKARGEPELASVPILLLTSHHGGREDDELATLVGASALVERTPGFTAEIEALNASLASHGMHVGSAADAALYERHLRTNAHQITRLVTEARRAEERYRSLFEHASDAITLLTPDGICLEANERWRSMVGLDPAEMVGRHVRDFAAPGHESANTNTFETQVSEGAGRAHAIPIRRADGTTIYMEFSVTVIEHAGSPMVLSIGHDVTEELQAARALAAAEEKYRSLVERIPEVIWTARLDGRITFITPNAAQVLGFTAQEMCDEAVADRVSRIHPDDQPALLHAHQALAENGTPFDVEYRRRLPDGRWIWVRNRSTAKYERGGVQYVEGMISDVTNRRRMEESYRQVQKMEAIGLLTGGVAHDFNNILGAILANTHFLLEGLAEHDPRRVDAEEIKVAAERAASLTRQLLAFSRRQVLETRVVDLNVTLRGIERMVRRLIGEDVELSVIPGTALGAVRVDIGQIEQVIMNLVVNARDAMPSGGKLVIEAQNVDLQDARSTDASIPPGAYVMLAVSDTGSGMDAETKTRIFEPFFTTKPLGRGTGLGLSTSYGIVKQSGGHIWVYSELGKGTVFKIYLPRVDEAPESAPKACGELDRDGSETVLLIEDDARIRRVVHRMLDARGYRVLVAQDGSEALGIAQAERGPVHLVLSDVVMPGGNGPVVAAHIQTIFPDAKILYMSGYTDHAVLSDGSLRPGANFIQKPFAPATLERKVREILDS